MTTTEKNGLDERTVSFILNRQYHLIQAGARPSKIRERIAHQYVQEHVGDSNKFCRAYDYLKLEGLVK